MFPTGKRWSVGKRKDAARQGPVAPLKFVRSTLYQVQSSCMARIRLDMSRECGKQFVNPADAGFLHLLVCDPPTLDRSEP